jgi:putative flippase GtrA
MEKVKEILSNTIFSKNFLLQAIRYGIVGLAGITTNLLTFSLLVYVIKVWYIIAGPIAGLVALTQNFILHRKFTFRGYSSFKIVSFSGLKRYIKFFLLSLINTPAFSSLLYFQVEILHFPKVVAQFFASVILGLFSFLISRKFIFS